MPISSMRLRNRNDSYTQLTIHSVFSLKVVGRFANDKGDKMHQLHRRKHQYQEK